MSNIQGQGGAQYYHEKSSSERSSEGPDNMLGSIEKLQFGDHNIKDLSQGDMDHYMQDMDGMDEMDYRQAAMEMGMEDDSDMDLDEEQDSMQQVDEGMARRRMLEIANKIADETPECIDKETKRKFQILDQYRKKNEEKGIEKVEKMIQQEQQAMKEEQMREQENRRKGPSALSTSLDITHKKDGKGVPRAHAHENIQDDVYDECGIDYQTKCQELKVDYDNEKQRTENLQSDMLKYQEDFIMREQEYRNTIKMVEAQIEALSSKPLDKPPTESADQGQLKLIKGKLNLDVSDSESGSDSNDGSEEDIMPMQTFKKKKIDLPIDTKLQASITQIQNDHPELVKQIEEFQLRTKQRLYDERVKQLKEQEDQMIEQRKKLEAKKLDQDKEKTDFKANEKKLQEKLELMTSMAEKIDEDNRKLIKTNNDLRIQYLAQKGQGDIKGDREILLQQILAQKKKQKTIDQRHAELKAQCDAIDAQKEKNEKILNGTSGTRFGNAWAQKNRQSSQVYKNGVSGLNKNDSHSRLRHIGGAQRTGTAPKMGFADTDGFNRPHTAAQLFQAAQTAGRPFTGNHAAFFNKTKGGPTNGNSRTHLQGFQGVQGAARAASAGFVKNPKLNRYEDLKNRLTKLLEQEKKNLRYVRTMCAAGIDTRNHLERVLRQCVTDVKDEIARKQFGNQSSLFQKGKKAFSDLRDEKNLTKIEKEKIIEVLLSQERVLTLLYDKTFPPNNPNQQNRNQNLGIGQTLKPSGSSMYGLNNTKGMMQFNYHGVMNQEATLDSDEGEINLEALEREVEQAVRCGTASAPKRGVNMGQNNNHLVNLQAPGFRSSQAGYGAKRQRPPTQPKGKRIASMYNRGSKNGSSYI